MVGLLTEVSSYNAKVHPHLPKLRALLAGLAEKADLHPEVIVVRHPFGVTERSQWDAAWKDWDDVVAEGREKKLGRTPDGEIEWKRLDFNWPLWILFSSGTTGASRALFLGSRSSSRIPNVRVKVAPSKLGRTPKMDDGSRYNVSAGQSSTGLVECLSSRRRSS